MRCCKCGRQLLRAAAHVPAGADHAAAPVGRTCAIRAGLIEPKPRLFHVKRRVSRRRVVTPQMELLA